ncbi:MAG: PepSY-associated TM helix domain-containing protein, partial [Solimonas sp.]
MAGVRPALLSIHRWIGLAFGLLLIVQALSGVAIVFREELNRSIHAGTLSVIPTGTAMSVQQMTDTVRAAHSGAPVSRIEYPASTDKAFLFRVDPKEGAHHRIVAVDPYRGVITRDGDLSEWPVEWLFELHHELLVGDTGARLVGIGGIALLFMALTGPFLWWPGRGRMKQGLSVTFRGGSYRGARDVHRVGGVAFALLLATSAFTGIVMVWKAPLQPVIGMVAP